MHGLVLLYDELKFKSVKLAETPKISDVVRTYKSLVVHECLKICNSSNIKLGKLWQRNYYEHIVRSVEKYEIISEYIINNPAKWVDDKYYRV